MSTKNPEEGNRQIKHSFRRSAAAPTDSSDLSLAWTGTDGVTLIAEGHRLPVSAEAWRRFVSSLIRGEFAQDDSGICYNTPLNPHRASTADTAALPTDADIAPALVQALGSAAGPAAIAAAEAAQPPVALPTNPVATTSCAW